MFRYTRRVALFVALGTVAGMGWSSAAIADWYHSNTSGTFGAVANGAYTNTGPTGSWGIGRLDNKTTGLSKFHFRVRYYASCSGSFDYPQWWSGNYGHPKDWQISYTAGGCGYSFGQNTAGGVANLRAGQF